MRSQVDKLGYAVIDSVLLPEEVDLLSRATDDLATELGIAGQGGVRDVLKRLPAIAELVRHPQVVSIVHAVLGPHAFAVRGVLFDKNAAANWKVPWHQDLSIAVSSRAAVTGYSAWSSKAGVIHVQPPVEVLERMLAVRVHLDECRAGDGPVRVLPGTHGLGRLASEAIATARSSIPDVPCVVGRGGVLIMRPLLLHASSSATDPKRRRVVHLEFAAAELAPGLDWYERWKCAA